MSASGFSQALTSYRDETSRRFATLLRAASYPPEGYTDGTFATVLQEAARAGVDLFAIAHEIGIEHRVFDTWPSGVACPRPELQNRVVALIREQLSVPLALAAQ